MILELVTAVDNFNVPDEIVFEFVDYLEKFRLKLISNYHKYLDFYLTFLPIVIGTYLNPNYRLALLSEEAIALARDHMHKLLKKHLLRTVFFFATQKEYLR